MEDLLALAGLVSALMEESVNRISSTMSPVLHPTKEGPQDEYE